MLNKKVTVLMPVYNGEMYLKDAIKSILDQTYGNFDFLIINDGSIDSSEKIIKSFDDPRIKYIKNDHNIGLIKTLNKGLALIESEYIIRMDADDISFPDRFEKQIHYMDNEKDVAVSGTSVIKFNNVNKKKLRKVYENPVDNKTFLLFGSPLAHPTVILRNKIIKENNFLYDENLESLEDYGLWYEISKNNKIGNLKEPLMYYRINDLGITQQADKKIVYRDNQHKKVYKLIFKDLSINSSDLILQTYREFITGRKTNYSLLSEVLNEIINNIDRTQYNLEIVEKHYKVYFASMFLGEKNIFELHKIYNEYFKNIFNWNILDDFTYILKEIRNKWNFLDELLIIVSKFK